jgi:predicted PurR-regulated permease PerM
MTGAAPTGSKLERFLGAACLLLLLAGSCFVMLPFLPALAWAFVMAFALWPAQRLLVARLRGRRTIAATLLTCAIALVLVLPTALAVVNLTDDAGALASSARRWLADGPPPSPPWVRKLPLVGDRAAARWDQLAADAARLFQTAATAPAAEPPFESPPAPALSPAPPPTPAPLAPQPPDNTFAKMLAGVLAWTRQWIPVIGVAIVGGLTQILLSVFLTFFIFRDGAALGRRLEVAIGRIAGERGLHLLEVAGGTVRSVVYGIVGTALVQGILAGIGFLVAGVPGAALLGLVTFCLSPLPVGPPLVWLPAALWLFHQGQGGWGVFMIVWGIVISSVDNVVKPWIISRGNKMPFILILFGVIGGALAFGFIGVFLGPTLLAVAYRLVEEWSREPAGAGVGTI